MSNPFETEREARELPAVQAIYRAFRADPGVGRMAPHIHRMLDEACSAAGIQLGAYDHRILAWLAGWEPQTCAVIYGLITRSHDAGLARAGATLALTGDQTVIVAKALADAETYRMREAAGYCRICEDDPRGICDDHIDDLEAAQDYHDLAAELAPVLPSTDKEAGDE